jgi:hypothetical protein
MLTGLFAQQLEARRARFNAKFAEAKRRRPRLDGAAFAEVLRANVAPVADAVARVSPERLPETVDALYDLALELTGQELLGPGTRYPLIARGWDQLLPLAARLLAESPQTVTGSLSNALYNLAVTPGARPQQWLELMRSLIESSPDAATLLRAGQVAAWRAGMAHYRTGALELCRALSPAIARAALGLPAADGSLDETLVQMTADPWFDPARSSEAKSRAIKIVTRVGAFRGFGGLFLRPPIVASADEHFLVTDGEDTWLLSADAFGATFHRVAGIPTTKPVTPFSLGPDGRVKAGSLNAKLPELADATSHAANTTTLAVTTALSHAVSLIGVV